MVRYSKIKNGGLQFPFRCDIIFMVMLNDNRRKASRDTRIKGHDTGASRKPYKYDAAAGSGYRGWRRVSAYEDDYIVLASSALPAA